MSSFMAKFVAASLALFLLLPSLSPAAASSPFGRIRGPGEKSLSSSILNCGDMMMSRKVMMIGGLECESVKKSTKQGGRLFRSLRSTSKPSPPPPPIRSRPKSMVVTGPPPPVA